jgi:hypothetical protein
VRETPGDDIAERVVMEKAAGAGAGAVGVPSSAAVVVAAETFAFENEQIAVAAVPNTSDIAGTAAAVVPFPYVSICPGYQEEGVRLGLKHNVGHSEVLHIFSASAAVLMDPMLISSVAHQ